MGDTDSPLANARRDLALQLDRYRGKHGLPVAVDLALRDTLTPDGLAERVHQLRLVNVLDEFLRFDGGDYGMRRAFDAYCEQVARACVPALPLAAKGGA